MFSYDNCCILYTRKRCWLLPPFTLQTKVNMKAYKYGRLLAINTHVYQALYILGFDLLLFKLSIYWFVVLGQRLYLTIVWTTTTHCI